MDIKSELEREQAELKELIEQIQALENKKQQLTQAALEKQGAVKMLQKLIEGEKTQ